MHARALPLVVVFAAIYGWRLSVAEPSPQPSPRTDASAYAIVWTPGEACTDEASVRGDTPTPHCVLPGSEAVTPR